MRGDRSVEKGTGQDVQAIQSNALIERHDAVPAVAGPVGLVAEADAADVALCDERAGEGGCCC